MANRGLTAPDSSNYGFYSVRLRESLRKQIAPSDYIPDSLMEDNENSFFDLFKLNKLDTLYIKDNVLKRVVKNDGLKQDTLSKKEERELRRQKRKNDKPIEN
jgi:hypothetical protein